MRARAYPPCLSLSPSCSPLLACFGRYDSDGSGAINKREFVKLTRSLGLSLTRKEAETIYQKLDIDGDGAISFGEVRLAITHPPPPAPPSPSSPSPSHPPRQFHPWWRNVKASAKDRLVGQAIESKNDWESELFLDKHDQAEVRSLHLPSHCPSLTLTSSDRYR